jgi:hypothetical protein
VYGPRSDINITYLPVIIVPEERSAETILRQYDYARAQRILSLTNYKSAEGPIIIATRQPLTNANSVPAEHLIQDLSAVPARAVELWVILFMNYALRQRFWERVPRDEFLAALRTYIASGGEKVESLAKSFASTTWQFNHR